MQRLILTVTIVLGVRADYTCICSFNGVRPVYEKADMGASVIGYLAMDQCAQFIYPLDAKWNTIMFKHQIGFIIMNDPSMEQHCIGEPSAHDILTTATPSNTTKIARTSIQSTRQTTMHSTATSTSTSGQYTAPPVTNFRTSAASQSTGQPSTNATLTKVVNTTTLNTPTTTTYTPTTSKAIVTVPITTTPRGFLLTNAVKKIPEGHTELCPDHVKTDASRAGGFVGQFGDYCYELVNIETQWDNAHRHCSQTSSGILLQITNVEEQHYVVRILAKHSYVQSVWIGLNDKDNEGTWRWNSGVPVTYTNFQGDFSWHSGNTHKLNDCCVLKQGGEWTDVPCGVSLLLGTGFGEKHPFICQYNLTSKPPSIFDVSGEALPPSLIG